MDVLHILSVLAVLTVLLCRWASSALPCIVFGLLDPVDLHCVIP